MRSMKPSIAEMALFGPMSSLPSNRPGCCLSPLLFFSLRSLGARAAVDAVCPASPDAPPDTCSLIQRAAERMAGVRGAPGGRRPNLQKIGG